MTLLVCWPGTFLLAQDAYIKGTITNGDENLPNATVSVGIQTTQTNRNGEFSLFVKAGKYILVITHVGHKKIEDTINIQTGQMKNMNYFLLPIEQMGEDVEIHSLAGIKRSNLMTPVPVYGISSNSLQQTGQPSLIQMVSAIVPSVNISKQEVWDNTTLRGFNQDQLLLTVDGDRYHPRSSLNFRANGQVGPGAVNNDLYAIPFSAIENIEVLLDGAAAHYGSDAIAGVLNIQLKRSVQKNLIQFNTGRYYPGDGQNINLGYYSGYTLFKKGFLSFAAGIHSRDQLNRGDIYGGTVYFTVPSNATTAQREAIRSLDNQKIAQQGFDRTQIPGYESMKLSSVGALVNGEMPIKQNVELYWTAIINYRYPSYLTAFRLPKNKSQVNSDIYPDGFLPKIISPIWDHSVKVGAKGKTNNNWKWNFVSSLGKNELTRETHNNNNASQQSLLGKNAPTSFKCGGTSFSQFLNSINFTKRIEALKKEIKSLTVTSGVEWRLENFQIKAGEETSWKNYDSTGQKNGGAQGLANFSDSNAVNVTRHVLAFYTDIETEINDRLLVDKAIRFENHSGYGSSLAGKLAARYKFSEKLSLRGSVSNSFRAPPLQQAYYSSTSSGWREENGIRIPAMRGIFTNNHDVVSNGFGVAKLKPEKAINISGGITSYMSPRFSATIDVYWIQVKDRIVFSGGFDTTNAGVKNVLQNYPHIAAVTFVCNAVNTRTIGGDIVIDSRWNFLKGHLRFTLAANLNRTQVFGIVQSATNLPNDSLNSNTLFNRGNIGSLEKLQPLSKFIFTTSYKKGIWSFMMVNRRFGSTEFIHDTTSTLDEFFSAKIVTDLNIKISPKKWYNISVGFNNLFNVKPDRVKNYANSSEGLSAYGNQYLPFTANGGYYFVSMNFNW